MAYYAVFLDLEGRPCVVVGGGEVAGRKVEGLRRAGARVRVIAPAVTPAIRALAGRGEIGLDLRPYRQGDLAGAALVIAATNDEEANREIAAEARERRVLLNVVDVPELSSFIAPAVLERGDLRIAVSTSGAAPALAAGLRDRIGELMGEEYAVALRLLRTVRRRLRSEERPAAERQRILRELAGSDLVERVRRGDRDGVDRILGASLGDGTTLDALGVRLD